MTVKEVFDLRKEGKIEEAYAAIRPMYAVHQGKYTTLCMFWTASDILKKRIQEKRIGEAEKIFEALLRVQPNIDDTDGKCHAAMLHAALLLDEKSQTFQILDFIEHYGVEKLRDTDWESHTATTTDEKGVSRSHLLPSTAQRMLTRCFHAIQEHPDADHALKVMPLLEEALRRAPRHKNNQRYLAVVYNIMGEHEKSIAIYRRLLQRYHDSYLFAELAEQTEDIGKKASLYCRAIQHQRQEKFRGSYRIALARLLIGRDNTRAAYEVQKCVVTRTALGFHNTRDINVLLNKLKGITPCSERTQEDFYRKMAEKYPI